MRSTRLVIVLTFVGMIGIYIGAYLAWQKYQAYQAQLQAKGTVGGLLSILSGNS